MNGFKKLAVVAVVCASGSTAAILTFVYLLSVVSKAFGG